MQIINEKISLSELKQCLGSFFEEMIKAVVDVEQEIIAIDAELHADLESFLLRESGSRQENLWGINLYPQFFGKECFIEFDSMINVRPKQNNYSRDVENESIREKIREIVSGKFYES